MPIEVVLADERRIEGGALDDLAPRSQTAHRKTDGRTGSFRSSLIGRHNHIVRIDAVLLPQAEA